MTRTVGNPRVRDAPLAELREWPRNPRRISKSRLEQLKRALEAEPEMLTARPLIALPDGTVIAGNQRLRAARELGWPSLPVVTVDLDEERAAEWALRDNRGYGEDDEQAVGELLAELGAGGRDLDLTGYGSAEIDALLAAVRPAGATDPDEAPPVPAVPRSVRGEVYELGPHRLMCGDATSEADVAALLAGERAAAAITDPPYNVGMGYGFHTDDFTREQFVEWSSRWLERTRTVSDLVLFTPGTGRTNEPMENLYMWRTIAAPTWLLIWVKRNTVSHSPLRGFNAWEPILLYGKPRKPIAQDIYDIPIRVQSAVATSGGGKTHPTPKQVALWTELVGDFTDRGGIVLDPFCGSGTTVIACEMLDRRCFAMELDPAYVDVIRQRYADFTNRPELAP